VIGGYTEQMDDEAFEELFLNLRDAFRRSNISDLTLLIHAAFGAKRFSIEDVFFDEREKLIERMLQKDIRLAEDSYRTIYERTYTLVNLLRQHNKQIPDILQDNIEVVINADLKRWFSDGQDDMHRLEQLVTAAQHHAVTLDMPAIGVIAAARLYDMVATLAVTPYDMVQLETLSRVIIKLNDLNVKFRLWKIQNRYFRIGKEQIGNKAFMRNLGDEEYHKWLLKFKAVGEQLKIRF
jgi:hypothetical protein